MHKFLAFILVASGCGNVAEVVLADDQNYTFSSEITASNVTITSGADTTVDWSGLTEDLLGTSLDPATDIDVVNIVQFAELDQEQVLAGINDGTLEQQDLTGVVSFESPDGTTSALLSQFQLFGTYIDPAVDIVEGTGTFLVSGVSGDDDYRMFSFFSPVTDAPSSPIDITSESAVLNYEVDLEGAAPIAIEPAKRVHFDWAGLTKDGAGEELQLSDIDRMLLARYDESLADLEADFLQVENIAEAKWSGDVEGYADQYLDELTNDAGEKFEGFDADGTWLVALMCSSCINPAPPFLAVLEPQ